MFDAPTNGYHPTPEALAIINEMPLAPSPSANGVKRVELTDTNPRDIIGGALGDAIAARSDRLSIPASVIINGLLPVAGSLLPMGTEVLANECTDFRQPPIIWNLSVAQSGSNKSETSDLAVKPLYRYQDAIPEDQARSFHTAALTMPGLSRLQADQPQHGCLIFPDELSGFIRRLHQDQQKGKGDELSRLLTLYDGRPQRGTFADKSRNFSFSRSSFSLLSTIQPSVLLEAMGDLDDESGLWARFNLCEIPLKRRTLPSGKRQSDGLIAALDGAYHQLRRLTPVTYELSDDADGLFRNFYDEQETIRLDATVKPALQAYAAKQEGRCARIALVLHCIRAAAKQKTPGGTIDGDTMQAAISVCRFYEAQLRRFYQLALAQIEGGLEGDALLVQEFCRRAAKPIEVRDLARGPRALRGMGVQRLRDALTYLERHSLLIQVGESWEVTKV